MRSPVLQWLLWTNLLMAASAAGWVVVTSHLLALPLDGLLVALAFVLAVAFYTRDRLDAAGHASDAATMPQRTAWVQRHAPALTWLVRLSFLVALPLIALRPATLPPLLAGVGFALSYTVRWLPWRGQRVGWKHLPGMKMPFVAILWAVLTVLTPAAVYGTLWEVRTGWLALLVALLIMLQILLNDLRDIKGDRAEGTLSLPVLVGEGRARRVGYALALAGALLALPLSPLALPLTALYTLVLLWGYQRPADARWRPWIEAQGVLAALLVALVG